QLSKNAPRVTQEMKIDHVHDDASARREPPDDGDVLFCKVPERQNGDVETTRGDQFVCLRAKTEKRFNAALLKQTHVTLSACRILRDETNGPIRFTQKLNQM